MTRRALPAALLVLLAGSAAIAASSITAEAEPDIDFSAYRTYAWHEGTPAAKMGAQDRIVAAVDRELRGHGLTHAETDPDAFVVTHVLVDRHSADKLRDPNYFEFWTGVTSVTAYELEAGTLVVDFVDAESGRIVWRGIAEGSVKGSASKMEKKVDKLIRRLFARFPAG